MYTIELISGPTLFYSMVVKLYLQLELTKEPTPYDTVEHKEPAQIDEPMPLL